MGPFPLKSNKCVWICEIDKQVSKSISRKSWFKWQDAFQRWKLISCNDEFSSFCQKFIHSLIIISVRVYKWKGSSIMSQHYSDWIYLLPTTKGQNYKTNFAAIQLPWYYDKILMHDLRCSCSVNSSSGHIFTCF